MVSLQKNPTTMAGRTPLSIRRSTRKSNLLEIKRRQEYTYMIKSGETSMVLEKHTTRLATADITYYPNLYKTFTGLFVRIGNLVVVAPNPDSFDSLQLTQRDLLVDIELTHDLALEAQMEAAMAHATNHPVLGVQRHFPAVRRVDTIMNDAGEFQLHDIREMDDTDDMDITLNLKAAAPDSFVVRLHDQGLGYHRTSAREREISGEIFRNVLGPEIYVAVEN
jgi:hypothetical protein